MQTGIWLDIPHHTLWLEGMTPQRTGVQTDSGLFSPLKAQQRPQPRNNIC